MPPTIGELTHMKKMESLSTDILRELETLVKELVKVNEKLDKLIGEKENNA